MSIPIKLNPLGLNKTNIFNIPLTFTALENNSSVKLIGENSENGIIDFSKMYYRTSINSSWIKYENQKIDLYNKGDYVQFWNKNNILTPGVFSYYAHFIMTGKISGSGNIQSLLNYDIYTNNYCFYSLFRDCTSLIYPPELLGKNDMNCYNSMFWGCSNLIKAPDLIDNIIYGQSYCQMFVNCYSLIYPAKMPKNILNSKTAAFLSMYNGCSKLIETPDFIINDNEIPYRCFYGMFWNCINLKTIKIKFTYQKVGQQSFMHMFQGCTSLVTAPELPATTLAPYCYQEMFQDCTSLVTAPELPSSLMKQGCYQSMFKNCTNLITPPSELKGNTMNLDCYREMFYGCTSLTTAPIIRATKAATRCFYEMFRNCTALTSFNQILPIENMQNYSNCYMRMFAYCSNLVSLPSNMLPTTILAEDGCYQEMFRECTSLVNAPNLPATTLTTNCYVNMFRGCTSLVNPPSINAITLADGCCNAMFYGCSSLIESPELLATTLQPNCYQYMFYGCNSLTSMNVHFTDWNVTGATTNWMSATPNSGTFIKPKELEEIKGNSNIRSGWNVINF